MKKCLIIGLGNMGKVHAKYLTKNSIEWCWYDPVADGPLGNNVDINRVTDFSHVFITSPEKAHFDNYSQIRDLGFSGPIFIEKPAALTADHVNTMLSDNNVFIGMVERFNPAVQTLKDSIDKTKIINIDFSRCCASNSSSKVSIIQDIGIHDIDLLFFILDLDKLSDYNVITKGNTWILTSTDPLVRMIWSKDTFFKERKITVRQKDCTYEVDLQEQSVLKHWEICGYHVSQYLFIEKSSPVENEQKEFFNGKNVNCRKSHEILLNLMEN